MKKEDLTQEIIWKFLQDDVCKTCENSILHCKHSSSTFLCEGSWCEEAMEIFIDDMCVEDFKKINIGLRKEKITKIKNNIKYETK